MLLNRQCARFRRNLLRPEMRTMEGIIAMEKISIVEHARRGPRGGGGAPGGGGREYLGRGPPPGTGSCYNCGNDGHLARDCKAGDWREKCYRCGKSGHIERNCRNSPRPNSNPFRSWSSSRGHGISRKSVSRGRSCSYSRSPPRRGRSVGKGGDRSPVKGDRSPMKNDRSSLKGDRSPMKDDRSPLKGDRSPMMDDRSPLKGNRGRKGGRSRSQSRSRNRSRTPLPKDDKCSLHPAPCTTGEA